MRNLNISETLIIAMFPFVLKIADVLIWVQIIVGILTMIILTTKILRDFGILKNKKK